VRSRAICSFFLGLIVLGAVVGLSRNRVPVKNTVRDAVRQQPMTAVLPAQLPGSPAIPDAAKKRALTPYGKLPLSFEVNWGQTDDQARFLSRGTGHTLFLNRQADLLLALPNPKARRSHFRARDLPASSRAHRRGRSSSPRDAYRDVLRMQLAGANSAPAVAGLEELPGKSNYFIGNDPQKWHTNVPTYAKVKYQNVYPGVDLVYYGNQRQLEYDFVVSPGADPRAIRMSFPSASRMRIDSQGDLILRLHNEEVRLRKPRIYQETSGSKKDIAGGYVRRGEREVGLQLAAYNAEESLVIDPVLVYSTYLGGTGDDETHGIAIDATGAAYVTGETSSANFPTTAGAFRTTSGGGTDVFVSKLNPAGNTLAYSTYLGGAGDETGNSIKVDSSGNAYVGGSTSSTDFPTTPSGFQTTFAGGDDAFLTKLNPTGAGLLYSTYFGSTGDDTATALALDSSANAYIMGPTSSINLPISATAYQKTLKGLDDIFIAKLDTTKSGAASLVYSTYVGGSDDDEGVGLAVDSAGNAYALGSTLSTDYPTTAGAFQTTKKGVAAVDNTFITKMNPTGSALVYSTYLGGTGDVSGTGGDEARAIALDSAGSVYVTGETNSIDFPVTAGVFQSTLKGIDDVFVTKMKPDGTGLVYSTYLGGTGGEGGNSIAVDAANNAYVTGDTSSTDFPTTLCTIQAVSGSAPTDDAFVAKLNPTGTMLLFSTYLGGSGDEEGNGISVDGSSNVFVTGATTSPNFPTRNPFQAALGTGAASNAFISKIDTSGGSIALAPASLTFAPQGVGTTSAAQTVTVTNTDVQAVNIASIAVSGDFAQTNTCGTSLAAGANCMISITSKPTAVGARNGTLTVTSSGCGSPNTLALNGTGIDFTITAAPPAVTVRSGETATYTVTITPGSNGFPNPVTLSASGLPNGAIVTFIPPAVTPGSSPATSTMKIATPSRRGWLPRALPKLPWQPPLLLRYAVGLATLLFALSWVVGTSVRLHRRVPRWAQFALFMLLLGGLAGWASGCNGGFPGSTTSVITVTGTSGALSHSTTVTLIVQ